MRSSYAYTSSQEQVRAYASCDVDNELYHDLMIGLQLQEVVFMMKNR